MTIAMLWLFAKALFAANEQVPETTSPSSEPTPDMALPVEAPPGDYGAAFVKMFLTLIALVAMLGLTAWFLRKIIRNKFQRGSGGQLIHILEKRMISPKTMLYLVEVDSQKVLLAESHLEVRRLHALQDVTRPPE